MTILVNMKKASVSEAKSRFSGYLNDVKRGETVLIFDRDRLVARRETSGHGRHTELGQGKDTRQVRRRLRPTAAA